ncbi:unnamed protein product [Amoebophrya sp. A25]|nr:unnamed protein product [Amoebophrya sp. A25]|eukprot:GSA25T00015797001.1
MLSASEVVVELAFENMDSLPCRSDTGMRVPGLHPDINQHRVFPLASGQNPNVSLSGDALQSFTNSLYFNVFDETENMMQLGGGAGGSNSRSSGSRSSSLGRASAAQPAVVTVRERRYLGTFSLPWPTVLANNCKVEGRFRVETPVGIIGYQGVPSQQRGRQSVGMVPTTGQPLMAGFQGGEENDEPMYLYASITLDRVLGEPDSGPQPIIPGRESRALLNHIHTWTAALGEKIAKENLAPTLGTDIEGHSRLISRFLTPQPPPPDVCEDPLDPFSIEKSARYVSLISFLTDAQMFEGRAVDLWCTSKTFLDIGCGDFEEHAILLCNYFNFIDGKRGEADPSYQVRSFCVIVEAIPDGEAMYVMRQDQQTGHCEFWDPIANRCYFVPRKTDDSFYKKTAAAVDMEKHTLVQSIPPLRWAAGAIKRWREAEEQKARFSAAGNLQPTSYSVACPIQKVAVVLSSENVWYNMLRARAESSRASGVASESCVLRMDWDLENHTLWRPLFADLDEKKHLFPDGVIETLQPPLAYDAPNHDRAKKLQSHLENDIWQKFLRLRSQGGLRTRSNAAIAGRCREMLERLEHFRMSRREGGNEAPAPLKSTNDPPVRRQDVDRFLYDLEEEFGGHRGLRVYGVPLNMGMSDLSHAWQAVENTNLVALGNDDAEFSFAVRAFAYSHRVFSIWLFLVCVTE